MINERRATVGTQPAVEAKDIMTLSLKHRIQNRLLAVFTLSLVLTFSALADNVVDLQILRPWSGKSGAAGDWTRWGANVNAVIDNTSISSYAGAFRVKDVDPNEDLPNPSGTPSAPNNPYPGTGSFNKHDFYSFCTDIKATIHWGDIYHYEPLTFDHPAANGVRPEWEASGIGVKRAFYLFHNALPSANTGAKKAGLQVALWEALYDSALNLANGRFKLLTGGDVLAAAAGYISMITGITSVNDPLVANIDSTWLHPLPEYQQGHYVQGLFYPDSNTPPLPTPDPEPVPDGGTTIMLFGLALSGFVCLRRKLF